MGDATAEKDGSLPGARELRRRTRLEVQAAQRTQGSVAVVYERLARGARDPRNAEVLARIAGEEREHYLFWKRKTGRNVPPRRRTIFRYYWLARVFGLTFGLKLLERAEMKAQSLYSRAFGSTPGAPGILRDEKRHEGELQELLREERLEYIGSLVLGLNDALVELTGALAGLCLALRGSRTIAAAGLITGVAASLSMTASAYLSARSDERRPLAVKNALYTGVAYVATVLLLVAPFLLLADSWLSLAITLTVAILIILFFTFYVSVAKGLDFRRRFLEMAAISLGVTAVSFGVGWLVRRFIADGG